MSPMRRQWRLAVALVMVGCASAPIRKPDAEALIEADRRVLAGCYDCLIDARDTYARIAVGRARPFVVNRLFEVEVLLLIREKELGLDWSATQARAEALVKELPTARGQVEPQPPPLDGARILAIAAAIPPDLYGWPSLEVADYRRTHLAFLKRADDELDWLRTTTMGEAAREYLAVTIDCVYPNRGGRTQKMRPPGWKPTLSAEAPPLLVFRRETCGGIDVGGLTRLRDRVPRFVDIGYFQGRARIGTLQQSGDVAGVLTPTVEFYQRFPRSSSGTFLRAQLNAILGDCREALTYYDETVALRPAHELALVGRVRCLSLIKRNEEAIQAATEMIALNTPQNPTAYYWRAWNHHLLTRLPEARSDIDRAKRLLASGEIYTLAGVIEHDQGDLGPAQKDLETALSLSGQSNCEAQWYLGLVFMKKETWLPAASAFERVMGCYEVRRLDAETARLSMERRENLDAEFKASQLANFDAIIEGSRGQYTAAAYNAAHFYARGGSVDKARELLKIAETDPALASRVAELRKIIGG
jgi:tetratricopeptide (TPR) repeat protein